MAENDFLHTAEILKTALPYVDVRTKVTMDLLLKFYELKECYRHLRTNDMAACGFEKEKVDLETMLTNIRPKCSEKERAFVDRILGIFNAKKMFEMYNTYMEAMKAMQEFQGFQSEGAEEEAADNVTNIFSGFDLSSIFGTGSSNVSDEATVNAAEAASDEANQDDSQPEKEKEQAKDTDAKKEDPPKEDTNTASEDSNNNMINMLKNMIPPEQLSTFENLRMLFNTMSYDDNSKSDQ